MHPAFDPDFRLTPEQRELIRSSFDPDALERFLAHFPAEQRDRELAAFTKVKPGEPATFVVRVEDPELQPILEQVYAPMWRRFPPEVLQRMDRLVALRREPIAIALRPASAGDDPPVEIIRRQTGSPRTFLILREDGATPDLLSTALWLLARDEQGTLVLPSSEHRTRYAELPHLLPGNEHYERLLTRLRHAPEREIAGVGVRSIEYQRIPNESAELPGRRAAGR